MWYLCGIGTNLDREINSIRILEILAQEFESLFVSEFIETDPVGIETDNFFLNFLVIISSKLNAAELKKLFNSLELQLGRDKRNPLSPILDRPIDIDILDASEKMIFDAKSISEPYYYRLLVGNFEKGEIRPIDNSKGLLPGKSPTAVYWDESSSCKFVSHKRKKHMDDRLESAFFFK